MRVKGEGCGGKGGAITLGSQMGFPQEGHAPVFSQTETREDVAADSALHCKGSADTLNNTRLLLCLNVSGPKGP